MRRDALRKLICLVFLLLFTPACKAAGADQDLEGGVQDQVLVTGAEPTIDGEIKGGEWGEAMVFPFVDNSEIFLLVKGEHLYLAIRSEGEGMISGNIFLEEGERISVLHSSAALGTAIYQLEGSKYQKIKDFSWCCRSKIDNEISQTAREEFYLAEGWLGANSYLGNENELEYKISLPEEGGMLAVNFIYVDGDLEKQTWPVGLDDGVAQEMVGGFPDTLEFFVGSWVALEDIK